MPTRPVPFTRPDRPSRRAEAPPRRRRLLLLLLLLGVSGGWLLPVATTDDAHAGCLDRAAGSVATPPGQYVGVFEPVAEKLIAEHLRCVAVDRYLAGLAAGRQQAVLEAVATLPVRTAGGLFLTRPVPGPITSQFGPRIHPILGVPRPHLGVDLRAPHDEPVHTSGPGVVRVSGEFGGYGNLVTVDHGGGIESRYAHLSAVAVRVGDRVRRGDVVGLVGSTGLSTGPHLHFEVRIDGVPTDPAPWLTG